MAFEDVGGVPAVMTGAGSAGDGFGGLIALFAIFALFGGGGMWGNRGAEAATGISNEFQYNALSASMDAGFNRVTTQQNFDTLDMTLGNIAHSIDQGNFQSVMATKDAQYAQALIAKDASYAALANNCETNRNIDSVKTQMAADTCSILNSQLTLAKDAELRCAYEKIAQQNTALSEQRIISTILETLQPPRAVPAYAAASPYSTFVPEVRLAGAPYMGNCGFAAA